MFWWIREALALARHPGPVAGADERVEDELCRALLEVGEPAEPGPAVHKLVAVGRVGKLPHAPLAVMVQRPHPLVPERRGDCLGRSAHEYCSEYCVHVDTVLLQFSLFPNPKALLKWQACQSMHAFLKRKLMEPMEPMERGCALRRKLF